MMLDAAGHLVLIDFGTCKDLWRPDLNGPEFCGTPGFMAPEMVASKPPAGAAVDLWALGCVAHQLLLGHPPFDAPSPYVFRGGEGGGYLAFFLLTEYVLVTIIAITLLAEFLPSTAQRSDSTK